MNDNLNFSAVVLLPFLLLQEGQYRGPEYEALFPNVVPARGNSATPSTNPTTGVVGPNAEGFNSWEFWFEINKDVLLRSRRGNLFEVMGPNSIAIHGADRVNETIVDQEIFPALEEAAMGLGKPWSHTALQALGKLGHKDSLPALEKAMAGGEAYSAMALGLIEDREALVRLAGILQSDSASVELRSYAALGLGLRNSGEGAAFLKLFVEKELDADSCGGEERDLMVASVAALGMSRDTSAVPLLVKKYKQLDERAHSRSRAVLCEILSALGKLGDESALSTIVDGLKGRDIELRRAAALACGDLGEPKATDALVDALEADSDVQVRGFAAISLGRIGGPKARESLRQGFQTKKSRTVKSFCAIALGLSGDQPSAATLRTCLLSKEDPSVRSAAALGLGFLRDQVSVPMMLDLVEAKSTSPEFRGYCALAVGLVRPDGFLPRMLKVLREDEERFEGFHRGLLLGIGLFHDPAANADLIQVLAQESRPVLRGHAALAIGMSRDKDAIGPLQELLSDKAKAKPGAPAFAAMALGALGERHNYPVLSGFFFNTNYRMKVGVLEEIEGYF